jgi:hypothetical protein
MTRYHKENHLKIKDRWPFFLIYLVLALIYNGSSIITQTITTNFDLPFHINRIVSLSTITKSPINFQVFHGLGNIVNTFYGWITIYPIYLLFQLTRDFFLTYTFFIFILTFFSLIICHYVMYYCSGSHLAGLTFSVLYTFAMYRDTCIFYRGALGEYISLAIIPLIFLAVYKIIVQKKDSWIFLAVVISLTVYTHIISALIAVFFIFISFVALTIKNKKILSTSTLTFFKASIACLLLTSGYLIPMIEQSLFQPINSPLIGDLLNRALPIHTIAVGSFSPDLSLYTIGAPLVIVLIVLFINFFKMNFLQKGLLLLGLLALLLTSKLFPWSLFQNVPIRIIQFPWRFMGVASFFIAFSFGLLLAKIKKGKLASFLLSSLLVIVLLFHFVAVTNNSQKHDNMDFSTSDIQNITHDFRTFDYAPANYQNNIKQIDQKTVTFGNKAVEFSTKINNNIVTYQIKGRTKETIILPLFYYKGITVTDNGKTMNLKKSPLVSFNSNESKHTINVTCHYTILSRFAIALSLITVLSLVARTLRRIFFAKKIQSKRERSPY